MAATTTHIRIEARWRQAKYTSFSGLLPLIWGRKKTTLMAMTASHLPHLPPPLVTKKNLPSNHPICPPSFLVCRVPILREERRRHSREESSQSRANRAEQGRQTAPPPFPVLQMTATPKRAQTHRRTKMMMLPWARGKIAQQRETSSKNWMMIHLTSIYLLALMDRVIGSN